VAESIGNLTAANLGNRLVACQGGFGAIRHEDVDPNGASGSALPAARLPIFALRQPGETGSAVNHAAFVELLTRVGCHIYSGRVEADGTYRELYTGPGIELFLGGEPEPDADLGEAWNAAVHPDDRAAYLDAATVTDSGVISVEYRMIGLDGITRWVLDQMWLREVAEDGSRTIDGVVTDISSRKSAEIGMRRLAHSDSLTGLANRLHLTERVDAAIDSLQPDSPGIALLLLDLDGFKAVNDSFGHAIGDELLEMVARRLLGALRPSDVAARLGGDEFALLLDGVDHDQALSVAGRVLAAIAAPFALSRGAVSISASIGVVHADDVRGGVDLMRDADVAMYRAKSDGKNRIVSFEPAMQMRVARRLRKETELRHSIENGDFVLHYQPLVRLDSRQIVGAEALVRWEHPERDLLPPAEFIEVAEDTGLIVQLGRWVVEQAVRDAAEWQAVAGRRMSVSANLSPRQLHDPDLVAIVAATLHDAGLPAEALAIEITENLLMQDADLARSRIAALRSMGVRIAVDDFGTGYSSLAYLNRYPVDILKIDRSFVDPLTETEKAAALARTIVDLAAAFKIDTVAEGIESEQQVTILRTLGCRLGQGYLFSKPVPAETLHEMLRSEAASPVVPNQGAGPGLLDATGVSSLS
jgi:diguanylate cyclase (GGDEF)-like protein